MSLGIYMLIIVFSGVFVYAARRRIIRFADYLFSSKHRKNEAEILAELEAFLKTTWKDENAKADFLIKNILPRVKTMVEKQRNHLDKLLKANNNKSIDKLIEENKKILNSLLILQKQFEEFFIQIDDKKV